MKVLVPATVPMLLLLWQREVPVLAKETLAAQCQHPAAQRFPVAAPPAFLCSRSSKVSLLSFSIMIPLLFVYGLALYDVLSCCIEEVYENDEIYAVTSCYYKLCEELM